jgi:hypothetical protein
MSRAATLPVSGTANGDSVLSAAIKAEEEAAKGSASKDAAERQAVDVWAPYGQLRLSGVGLLEFELEWRPPSPSEHVITPAVPTTLRVNFRFAYKDATEGRAVRTPTHPSPYPRGHSSSNNVAHPVKPCCHCAAERHSELFSAIDLMYVSFKYDRQFFHARRVMYFY